jgi:hypothetical protein
MYHAAHFRTMRYTVREVRTMTTAMQSLLDRYELDEGEVADAVTAQLSRLPVAHSAELTEESRALLTEAGLRFGPKARQAGHRAHRDAVAEQVALLTGPDTAQVAARAGVAESRVRHWVADGTLLGIRVGQRRRFPMFQFGPDGRPLPGLGAVLAAVPTGWPPAQVAAFMTSEQPELALDGSGRPPLTPTQWLAAGGDPAAVTALLQSDW